jgi:hypothetical protein
MSKTCENNLDDTISNIYKESLNELMAVTGVGVNGSNNLTCGSLVEDDDLDHLDQLINTILKNEAHNEHILINARYNVAESFIQKYG